MTQLHSASSRHKGIDMEYRNKKTGVVIDVNSELRGDWEPVNTEKPAPKKTPKKSGAKKK